MLERSATHAVVRPLFPQLARSWESLNEIISAMGSSLVKIAPFSIILALFMFIYSLLGMQVCYAVQCSSCR